MESTAKKVRPRGSSTDKRRAILKAALEIYCKKGYEHTTMTDIAQMAGVAIGTLYKHYPDKKKMFLDMYELYFFEIAALPFEKLKNLAKPFEMRKMFESIVDSIVQGHKYAPKHIHDAMMALVHYDEDFKRKDNECKLKLTDMVITMLDKNGFSDPYYREKLHFFINVVELYSHEVVYHETEGLEYANIKESLIFFSNCFLYGL